MVPIDPEQPIGEVDGREAPLGVSCITDRERGKIANLFIHEGDLYFIIEPDVVVCISKHGPGTFLLKAGHAGPSAAAVPSNFGQRFIGRMLTDAKVYPDKIEVEIDLGMMGVDILQNGFFAWQRQKPPAIN